MKQSIRGVVFGFDGAGLAETSIIIFERDGNERHRILGIGTTTDLGEYQLQFSAEDSGNIYCCFFKDGYEPGFRELGQLQEGEVADIDAILHHAVPMEFEIKNRLGFSLPGLRVRITAEGDHLYPITYSTNALGIVHTQLIFREEGRYQLAIMSGGIELHVEKFLAQNSRSLEIRIPGPIARSEFFRKSGLG